MIYRSFLLVVLMMPGFPAGAASAADELEHLHIIDWHAHVAGLGYGASGNFVSARMRDNYRFRYFLRWMGASEEELARHGDQIVIQRLSQQISQSRYVDQAVVLAMDGVIDEASGLLDREQTHFYVANDFVARETARYPQLLFGASVNPKRINSLALLDQVQRQGAVLIKWIPSIMHIDPGATELIPFYRRMVELGLPLLTHTGMEKSFPDARDELADPKRLQLPLEMGVTVIAAHIATTGTSGGQDNFARILPMFAASPGLYADISSLTQINKMGYLARALEHPRLTARMIYGTDWPLQYFPVVTPWYHLLQIGFDEARRIHRIDNRWDRDIELKRAYGVPLVVFSRVPGR